MQEARWIITTLLSEFLEPIQMTVHSCEEKEVRVIVRMELGPFDYPSERLEEMIQMIDQAVWAGKPLQLPISPAEEQVQT